MTREVAANSIRRCVAGLSERAEASTLTDEQGSRYYPTGQVAIPRGNRSQRTESEIDSAADPRCRGN